MVLLLRYESSFFNMIVCHKFEATSLERSANIVVVGFVYTMKLIAAKQWNQVASGADLDKNREWNELPLLKTKIYRIIPHLKQSIDVIKTLGLSSFYSRKKMSVLRYYCQTWYLLLSSRLDSFQNLSTIPGVNLFMKSHYNSKKIYSFLVFLENLWRSNLLLVSSDLLSVLFLIGYSNQTNSDAAKLIARWWRKILLFLPENNREMKY